MSAPEHRLIPVLRPDQQRVLLLLVLLWSVAIGLFLAWWLQPSHWAGPWGMGLNTLLLMVVTALPAWTYLFVVRMKRINPLVSFPNQLKLAMVVTKAPSEPWGLVQETLEAMLSQVPEHDTWLADEDPTEETLSWCLTNGIQVSTRRDHPDYGHTVRTRHPDRGQGTDRVSGRIDANAGPAAKTQLNPAGAGFARRSG